MASRLVYGGGDVLIFMSQMGDNEYEEIFLAADHQQPFTTSYLSISCP